MPVHTATKNYIEDTILDAIRSHVREKWSKEKQIHLVFKVQQVLDNLAREGTIPIYTVEDSVIVECDSRGNVDVLLPQSLVEWLHQ